MTPTLVVSKTVGLHDVHLNLGWDLNASDVSLTRATYAAGVSIRALPRLTVLLDVLGSSGVAAERFTVPVGVFPQTFGFDDLIVARGRNGVVAEIPRSDLVNLNTGLKIALPRRLVASLSAIVPLTTDGSAPARDRGGHAGAAVLGLRCWFLPGLSGSSSSRVTVVPSSKANSTHTRMRATSGLAIALLDRLDRERIQLERQLGPPLPVVGRSANRFTRCRVAGATTSGDRVRQSAGPGLTAFAARTSPCTEQVAARRCCGSGVATNDRLGQVEIPRSAAAGSTTDTP